MKFLIFILVTVLPFLSFAQDKFPLRKEFPTIPIIEQADAMAQYEKLIFIDVRSKIEFETIHVAKSLHIGFSNPSLFEGALEKVRAKDGADSLVLYCNGIKCKKSFEAADYAIKSGFKNILVMDSGILNWAKAYPDKSFLMGQSPADPKTLISEEAFKAKLLNWEDFKKGAEGANAISFDVRDTAQIKKKLEIKGLKYLPLNEVIPLVKKGTFKENELYFLDAVGKQVDWLQYYLEGNGYTKYYFLSGGADGN